MRIVSQDKMFSFDVGNTSLMCQQGCIFARQIGDQSSTNIGAYDSQERANEVFEDIHRAYSPVTMISSGMQTSEVRGFISSENVKHRIIAMNDDAMQEITIFDNIVYYMPEE